MIVDMIEVLNGCSVENPIDGIDGCMINGSGRTVKRKDEEMHPQDEQQHEGIELSSKAIR